MERWPDIVELALIVAVLVLRRVDVRALRTRLTRVAQDQGALVELVRSSLRPPEQRCGDCDHTQGKHTSRIGALIECSAAHCSCGAWVDPPAPVTFEDETPVLRGRRSNRPGDAQ